MSQEEAISRLSGFRVSSLGLRTSSSDFGALGQGCRAQDLLFRVSGLGFDFLELTSVGVPICRVTELGGGGGYVYVWKSTFGVISFSRMTGM